MRKVFLLSLSLICISITANSQYVYKIKADSVLITNDSCTAELNLENSTKHIKGFLLNTGNGRTRFSRPEKLGDTAVVIGIDTIRFGAGVSFSALNGLSKIGNTVQLGGALTKSDTLSVMDSSLTFHFNNGSYKRIGMIGDYWGNIQRYSSGRFHVYSERSVRSNDYWNYHWSIDTLTKGYSMYALEPTWGLKVDAGTFTSVAFNPRPSLNLAGTNVRTRLGLSTFEGLYLTRFNLTDGEKWVFNVTPTGIMKLYVAPPLGSNTDSLLVWDATSKEVKKISQSSVGGGGGGGGADWTLTGNTGITNSNFLGTTNNSSLRIRTNNIERMVVDSMGNVGIGVLSPIHRLSVNGNLKFQTSEWRILSDRSSIALGEDAFGNYLFYGDTTSSRIFIGLGHQNKFHKFQFQSAGHTGDSTAMYNFVYNPALGNAFQVYSFGDGNTKFMISANGNVGIGTTNPGVKLQIEDGTGGIWIDPRLSRVNDRIRIGNYGNPGDGQLSIISTSSDAGGTYKVVFRERDGAIGLGLGNAGASSYAFGKASSLRVHSDGRIGLGTNYVHFGNFGGPLNSSSLVTYVSNTNEWDEATLYPNDQNFYYFGTWLQSPSDASQKRAPLKISGRSLQLLSGRDEAEAARISDNGNVLIGTTTDAGFKLDVNGTARVSTIPFIAKRDTILTYNPSTKQIAATRIPVTNLMTGSDIAGTTTAFATVTGLSFPVVANTTYRFRFFIVYTAAATATGSKWSITGPSVAGGFLHYGSEYSLTATTKTFNQGLSAYDLPAGVANATSASTGSNIAVIEGVIKPTANGTVSARVATETAGSAITAKAGISYVQFEVLQ